MNSAGLDVEGTHSSMTVQMIVWYPSFKAPPVFIPPKITVNQCSIWISRCGELITEKYLYN